MGDVSMRLLQTN